MSSKVEAEKKKDSGVKNVKDEKKKDSVNPLGDKRSYQEWRDSPDGRYVSQSKIPPRSGLPDFGGRKHRKTRRGRKSRSTRRR
jgi:hypothetical protein